MSPATSENRTAVMASIAAMVAMIAFQVGGRATREALFLSSFGAESLPAMVMATSVLAIGGAFLAARAITVWGPGRVLPVAFAASAVLLLGEWAISLWFRRVAAVLLYLHYGCFGALLISGFWSMANERFDPRTARLRLGTISAWGTVGGLLGGLIATQVARSLPATAMLPLLAALHLAAAAAVSQIRAGTPPPKGSTRERDGGSEDPRSGLRALSRSTYLRGLVLLVVLTAIAEGFLDLAFRSRAASAFLEEGTLLRFFAIFYTAMAVLTLLVQALLSQSVLEKLGPARTAAALPAGAAVSSAGALLVPGLTTVALARGAESVLANSLYRAGYEVLFTPLSPREKRPAKALADVGAARIGDLIAAGLAQCVLLFTLTNAPIIWTALALAASLAGLLAATRLGKGYVRTLELGLQSRAIALDLSEVRDRTTRSILLRTTGSLEVTQAIELPRTGAAAPRHAKDLEKLPTDDVISLLARDDMARKAIDTLRKSGREAIGPLVARLLDSREDVLVRRRIPLVLASCSDPAAVEGLARGLGDPRFEVRYRCARGLSHLLEDNPALRVEPATVYEAVLREVEAGVGVWEGKRLLDQHDDESWSPVMDEVIRDRANRSLEHVFTLLALVLPRRPLRIAFRGLHAEDANLRGYALEYLESALPAEIRKRLWPYLEDRRRRRAPSGRSPDEALHALLQSNESIVVHLEELRRKGVT